MEIPAEKSNTAERGEPFGRHNTFGLSRKNALTWLAAVLAVLSAVVRIIYYAKGGTEGASLGSWRTFLMIILPVASAVIFAAEILIHGRDRLYKTGFAVLLGVIFFVARIFALYHEGDAHVTAVWHIILSLALYLAVLIVWELTTNAARIKTKWIAFALFAIPLLVHLFVNDIPDWRRDFDLMKALPYC